MAAVTWDAATAVAVTLSGGNLVATNTGTASLNQGVRVADANGKTSGKHYFEITCTVANLSLNSLVGICTTTSTYPTLGTTLAFGVVGNAAVRQNGNLWTNGVNTGVTIGVFGAAGQTVSVAVDLDNRQIWFRRLTLWNNSGTADPATNTGGFAIPSGIMVPFCTFGGTSGAAGNVYTANFGASTFLKAVPVGFASGWLEATVEVVPPPASGYAGGASRGRMIRKFAKRKREDEEEQTAEIPATVSEPPPTIPPSPPAPPPPPPPHALMAGIPIPPITVLRSPPVENEDEIEIALLLELLS